MDLDLFSYLNIKIINIAPKIAKLEVQSHFSIPRINPIFLKCFFVSLLIILVLALNKKNIFIILCLLWFSKSFIFLKFGQFLLPLLINVRLKKIISIFDCAVAKVVLWFGCKARNSNHESYITFSDYGKVII